MPRTILAAALLAAMTGASAQSTTPPKAPAQPQPQPQSQPQSIPESLTLRASQRLKQGDVEGAVQDLNIAIARDEHNSAAHALRGSIRMSAGNTKGALDDLSRSIELTPNVKGMEVVYVNRANLYWLGDQPKPAMADVDKAMALNANFALAFNMRGRLRADANDLDGALSDFNRAIELEPRMMPAYSARAAVNMQAGRLQDSIGDYKTMMWTSPKDAAAVASHGILRGMLGETDAAVSDLLKAGIMDPRSVSTESRPGTTSPSIRLDQYLELNPNEPRAHLMRGALAYINGDADRGKSEMAKAIQLDPKLAPDADIVTQRLAR
jgi:tetratricopeptide (TPR) repeat protein